MGKISLIFNMCLFLSVLLSSGYLHASAKFSQQDLMFNSSLLYFSKEDAKILTNFTDRFVYRHKEHLILNFIKSLEIYFLDISMDKLAEIKAEKIQTLIKDQIVFRVSFYQGQGHSYLDALTLTRDEIVSSLDEKYPILKSFKNYSMQVIKILGSDEDKSLNRELVNNISSFIVDDISGQELLPINYNKREKRDLLVDTLLIESDGVTLPAYPRKKISLQSGVLSREEFSARVRFKFLGIEIDAGPTIAFERRYIAETKMFAAGNEPIIIKSSDKQLTTLNHNINRRVVVQCLVTAQAGHELSGSAGLSFLGSGVQVQKWKWDALSVSQSGPLFYAPFKDKFGNETTFRDLVEICEKTYPKEIKKSLDLELKYAVSQLVYSHPLNECVTDLHCEDFYMKFHSAVRKSTKARCVSKLINGNPVNSCQLKSIAGGNCSLFNSLGRRVTKGYFEYPCSQELKCVQISKKGLFRKARAVCR